MTAILSDKPWDFSQVLELVKSLQFNATVPLQCDDNDQKDEHIATGEKEQSIASLQGLGDFGRVFQFLGTPVSPEASNLTVQPPDCTESARVCYVAKDDYASDGATFSVGPKTVQFEEQSGNEEQGTTDVFSDGSVAPDTPTLTKKQRKKRFRKEKRAREAAFAAEQTAQKVSTSISESEAEVVKKKTSARAASVHVLPATPQSRYNLRERNVPGKANASINDDDLQDAVNIAIKKVTSAKKASVDQHNSPSLPIYISPEIPPSARSEAFLDVSNQSCQQHDHSTPSTNATKFVPSSVQPPRVSAATKLPSSWRHATTNSPKSVRKHANVIEPMTVRSGEDRHYALLMKLIRNFYEDRRHIVAPMNLTTHNNDQKGIHVFVDASNIFIGFNEQLKLARGIPSTAQIPSVDLSFDALALLMERRRPVAKRVLVGSTPHLPAFDKAKAVGYECSILEKVLKARELTERQIYFKELDSARFRSRTKVPPANNVATPDGKSGSGSGSGSETNAPQYAPPRMIEQGVDEILHLKILESVVDADEPGKIVLATGDAARAEYSEGFMAMAYRALKKGWSIELVSWSKNISAMYTKRQWVEAWGDRFRVVLLDDYAEELLDI